MPRARTSEKKIQRERNLPYMDIFEHFLFISREFYELRDSNISLAGRLSFVTLKIFAYHLITKLNLEPKMRRYARVAKGVKYYFDFFRNLFN